MHVNIFLGGLFQLFRNKYLFLKYAEKMIHKMSRRPPGEALNQNASNAFFDVLAEHG
jgi:hypothetical protein